MEKQKSRTLNRLDELGIDTEKKIKAMTIRDMLSIPGITVSEINIITELQEAIKENKVIVYLCGGVDEVKEENKEATNGSDDEETGESREGYPHY